MVVALRKAFSELLFSCEPSARNWIAVNEN